MKEYLKKNKLYFIGEGLFICSWYVYYVFFCKFYNEAFFYVEKKAKLIIQLLFMTTYYSTEVLIYSTIAFMLMTLNLLLFLLFFIQNKQKNTVQKQTKAVLIVFLLMFSVIQVKLLSTILWPIFLILVILSLTVIYIIFAVTKYLYEENEIEYEENEPLKVAGPFENLEEANDFSKEFLLYWQDYFSKKNLKLEYSINQGEQNKYFVDFNIKSIESE